ncbi:F-box protein At2g02240-like [Juglans microcarpa x Juglans regia]|uniref:F-box protein At2g02240-like n=1 Tax=Juglans microcarpa x Juglans regia TaxID=2249226 RepID=UPI001B7E9AE3|nr:F-box protein At2g02240-like [Juglans microcarpa x Juglans regia]
MATAETEAVGLLDVLPEGCVANVLSFTSPPDACRSSCVSTTFRSAADSDAVWDRFLPPECQSIISRSADSSSILFSSKKELYLRLCDHPLLIDDGKKSFFLEKRSGKKCFMLSPKELVIIWIETPRYWKWTSLPDARFPEVAELISVCWLEIRGKISTSMLSPATLYATYLVFKTKESYGFDYQPVEVAVGLVGAEFHKRTVYLDTERGRRLIVRRRGIGIFNRARFLAFQAPPPPEIDDAQCPKERGDGWLEIGLGEFFNGEENGELEMSVLELNGHWKGGLIVQGIEIRAKEST